MFAITDRRLDAAKPILDEYKRKLDELGRFDAGQFETELRKVWRTGYREIKDAAIALYKQQGEYAGVAEHYMQTQGTTSTMVSEFRDVLQSRDHFKP